MSIDAPARPSPAELAPRWRPACMDDEEWALWKAANDRIYVGMQAARPCADCPLGHAADMRAEGRCNGTPGGVEEDDEHVDEGTVAAVEEHRRTAPKEGQDVAQTGPTDKQVEAWNLVAVRGLSQVQAADHLGITQAGVQSRLRGYMDRTGTPGPIPGYASGNGPITVRRVAPEALDAPATTSATEAAGPAAVAVQDDADSSSDPGTEVGAALPAAEAPTVPVLVEAGSLDEPEDHPVEAPPHPGGSAAGASTVIPWPAVTDHEARDLIDVFIRERDRLGAELGRVDQQLEQLTQVRERLLTMRSAIEDTLGLYAEHLTASAVA